ncbi:uncharacterized protein LOC111877061 [Lactuca sativa]|uniref:Uncharacterized protein n=1 Tax=Lactuca sativa TaxID=4236 RepID=A0A9R1WBL8_LACSA|nr:uncharacterized protein LOC111877061 [Lactuca sativa]KAJ0219495.1 hypothetical protein LSAT_V11C300150990 [Lactuca sativa]
MPPGLSILKNSSTPPDWKLSPIFTEYYARLKTLFDQLANVGNPVSEMKMVLQLISGLSRGDSDTIATLIQQSDPLSTFNKARSQLLLEETRCLKQDQHNQHDLVTQHPDSSQSQIDSTQSHENSSSGRELLWWWTGWTWTQPRRNGERMR